ncbi:MULTISPECIES: tripartite tricarboxylate transporter substrate-binding protein [unclassified Beijerinckia]|uniref:Bug family tripartite tricarboxylate transporter substrate binding protein n=1 Tax=unclassified Beijerinckia TaxID=2638183 RepID=UPI00089B90C0|nr:MULTISPECIES: tripartite tricarboxylate transporter substrate-binding protein [unclassified Beijerinckia]MDH7795540.1 tripartite-type tricarboxylate transporter receptor subunit TctC [Beijerinckia sp. GAS462]SEC05768.1 Tripartite-type tricarboxylate transporter, receptor component TctC [Beijerinckia sp. 28-YEA-48]
MNIARILARLGLAATVASTSAVITPAFAWPDKPIKIIVPFAAGGTTDVIARIMGERLGAQLKTTVLVENLPGAGGNLGAAAVAKATGDAHVLLMSTPGPAAMNQFMYARMPYDTASAFTPIAFVASIPSVLIVNASADYKTVVELVTQAKARPQQFNYGSAGNGSTGHLGGALLNTVAGMEARHVPYRGSAPMLQDLIGGNIQFTIDSLPGIISFIEAGTVRALAVTGGRRAAQLPNVPTSLEAGFGDVRVSTWLCFLAPAGITKDTASQINNAVNAALAETDVRQKLSNLGADVDPDIKTPDDLARFLASETPNWKRMVEAAAVKIE